MTASAVRERPLASLSPWDRNPRRISGERLRALKRSLEADREMLRARPLIALPDGRVVCGNQRLVAARELGWETIPTMVVELEEQRAALWALRDNNSYGEWDDTLGELLAELAETGADLDLAGFQSVELEALLAEAATPVADPEAAPPLPRAPHSRRGELYDLGPHRLLCADATDLDAIRELAADALGRAELLWTDPPYGVDYQGKTREQLRISNDQGKKIAELLAASFAATAVALAADSRFYVCSPAAGLGAVFVRAIEEAGWRLHQSLVWVKQSFVLGRSDYHYQHEQILYGYTQGSGRPGRNRSSRSRWYGDNRQSSVFMVDRPQASREHPTMKPVALIAAQLTNSSRRGDIVLDPFAGSGSTLIACEQLGRRCLAVELDPAYCDVIRQRYADYTGNQGYAPTG